ncbi:tol-pal system protein YbgF [Tropicimonas sp. S265A]|uniref:tol-pal system protein YbgF n=1 Tax=Tropicimonas sp. S265A TaxID=3415134 RepID=UPI003C7BB975
MLSRLARSASLFCLLGLGLPAQAQVPDAQTLADIRQELSVLFVEIQRLRRELSTTGSPQITLPPGALERVDTIEAELSRLTAKTEQLEFRIDSIVTDGTNRIGDLEFRLVELEGGDFSQLGETTTLGGEAAAPEAPVPVAPPPSPEPSGPELALAEQADFDAARALLDDGQAQAAADAFATYAETYPGGPLVAEAHYLRGEALASLSNWNGAARAYLDSFSGTPNGPQSPNALYKLGVSLNALGQRDEACLTLREVSVRFPGGPAAVDANTARGELSCP